MFEGKPKGNADPILINPGSFSQTQRSQRSPSGLRVAPILRDEARNSGLSPWVAWIASEQLQASGWCPFGEPQENNHKKATLKQRHTLCLLNLDWLEFGFGSFSGTTVWGDFPVGELVCLFELLRPLETKREHHQKAVFLQPPSLG